MERKVATSTFHGKTNSRLKKLDLNNKKIEFLEDNPKIIQIYKKNIKKPLNFFLQKIYKIGLGLDIKNCRNMPKSEEKPNGYQIESKSIK